jgi:hypothetical protein
LRSATIVVVATCAAICFSVVDIPSLGGGERAAVADGIEPLALTPATPNKPVSFRDRLIAGLRARLDSEIAFVDAVVAAVADGDLPQPLVDQTYFWARQRSTRSRDTRLYRPIIYFQIAMRARAERLGVEL